MGDHVLVRHVGGNRRTRRRLDAARRSAAFRYHSARPPASFRHEHHDPGTRAPSAARSAALQGGRHRARALPRDRGHPPADPGLRGHRDQAPGRRCARDVHCAQELVRRRRRANVPAPLAEDRQDRGRRDRRRATARSSTTCAARSARRLASASSVSANATSLQRPCRRAFGVARPARRGYPRRMAGRRRQQPTGHKLLAFDRRLGGALRRRRGRGGPRAARGAARRRGRPARPTTASATTACVRSRSERLEAGRR